VRTLITGGGGQLASDLEVLLGAEAVAIGHAELDINDPPQIEEAVRRAQPELIINCAAFHNVDVCEREPDVAWQTNVRAVRDLAQAGVPLVHFSTNYVFDGRRPEPYGEDDLPHPRSIYGITKLAGEHAALAYSPRSLVVRTAGLYGLRGNASKGGNFVQRTVARARSQGRLRMVADQRLQPTFTGDLAQAVIAAVHRGVTGVLHLVAGGACSWLEFTEAIMQLAEIEVEIEPATTEIGPGQPDRPLNGVLASPRSDALGLARMRAWRDQLSDYMQRAGLAGSYRQLTPVAEHQKP
jgi:dTDP-4-dehydrorhamnose reductase